MQVKTRLTSLQAGKTKLFALVVDLLSVEPSLLYLLGEPVAVWKKLGDQFQKKSWANKLELRRRLYSLKLDEGGSVQAHIKTMMEVFEGLSVVGDPISEEDRVVHHGMTYSYCNMVYVHSTAIYSSLCTPWWIK